MDEINKQPPQATSEAGAEASPAEAEGKTAHNLSRRRLLKLAVGASPVIATLNSKSVLAGGSWGGGWGGGWGGWGGWGGTKTGGGTTSSKKCGMSGTLSGNLSTPQDCECVGQPPEYWCDHPDEWKSYGCDAGNCKRGRYGSSCRYDSYDDSGTPFFNSCRNRYGLVGFFDGPHWPCDSKMTMMQVLQKWKSGDSRYECAAQACAAYLNSCKYPIDAYYTFGMSPDQVCQQWDDRHATDTQNLCDDFRSMNYRGA